MFIHSGSMNSGEDRGRARTAVVAETQFYNAVKEDEKGYNDAAP